jgi:tetratricopeptide (TPR) repeat protein
VLTYNLLLAEEFYQQTWTTYALSELTRFQGKDDTADRIEKVTRILASGNASAKMRATEILAQWIENNSSDVHVGRFRLRRAIYLKELKHYEAAFEEAKKLVEMDPSSASLRCFRGNILGALKKSAEAITDFEAAMQMDQTWSEPRLELVERRLIIGNFVEALDDAERFLALPGAGAREMLVLKTLRVVASALIDSCSLDEAERKADLYDVEQVLLDSDQREDWTFEATWRCVRSERQLPGANADQTAAIKERLYNFMCVAQKKLMSDKDLGSLGDKPPFRR